MAESLPTTAPATELLTAQPGEDLDGLRARARERSNQLRAAGARFISRSYRFPYALIASHEFRVGVDIERIEPFEPAFIASISTPAERRRLASEPDVYATSLWSSKEALAKALGDPVAYDPRRLGSPIYWRDGKAGPWRAKQLDLPAGHNGWLCWRVS